MARAMLNDEDRPEELRRLVLETAETTRSTSKSW